MLRRARRGRSVRRISSSQRARRLDRLHELCGCERAAAADQRNAVLALTLSRCSPWQAAHRVRGLDGARSFQSYSISSADADSRCEGPGVGGVGSVDGKTLMGFAIARSTQDSPPCAIARLTSFSKSRIS